MLFDVLQEMNSLCRVAWLCLTVLFAAGCSGRSTEAKLQTTDGYEVKITTDTFVDVQPNYYCELFHKGSQLKPPHFFESTEQIRYKLIEGANNVVFKIVDADTGVTLIMFDRQTGEGIPWTSDTETNQETDQKILRLEARFKEAQPQR